MLKNILKLNGAQQLNKVEQLNINGGGGLGCLVYSCTGEPDGTSCINTSGNLSGCNGGLCYEC